MSAMWYDLNKTLSYNCLFNFIVGNRGCGKTFAGKDWAIKDFKKNGAQFVYVRRYKQELRKVSKFFDDIASFFPDDKFEVKGYNFYINSKLAGTAIALSTAKIEKSTPFPLVNKIIFDEFIIEKGVYHYLPDEVISFLELYETIARSRDVRAFFLSNAITITNPYFIYFDLSLPYGRKVSVPRRKVYDYPEGWDGDKQGLPSSFHYEPGDILLQLVQDEEFIDAKKKTRFGKMIVGTDYANYSIENQFLLDNKNFVEKKTQESQYFFTFNYKDVKYGVWVDYYAGKMFVSRDIDPNYPVVYSLTMADHSPNTMLLKGQKKGVLFVRFIEQYKMGNVRFENVGIKNMVQEVLKLTL